MADGTGFLGSVPPERLVDARLTLHWALQPVASVGRTHHPHRDDDSHTNVGWSPACGALVGHPVGPAEVAVGLRVRDLALILVGPNQTVINELPLVGRTVDEAYTWITGCLRETSGTLDGDLKRQEYDLTSHPPQHGFPFERIDDPVLAELARWYSAADDLLGAIAREHANASAVRCWPHHFDIATLITLPEVTQTQPTIGVGMSPGDGTYAEPYWYVTPWPSPSDPPPALLPAGGHWHKADWFGAVLTATKVGHHGDVAVQRNEIRRFLRAAIEAVVGRRGS